ncbi:Cellular adhesion and filamentous growth protein [Salvia divinorum]|uniref:Transmembrane 9 superfamily member n=1 Tax=Salvia divinorum TaxID=28513 RepID=A0ABD1FYC7_SALDI
MSRRGGGAACHVVFLLLVCTAIRVRSDASDHKYKAGDPVPLYANKVGPFRNPSETYRYFDLPFCSPGHVKDKKEALADKESEVICKKKLSKKDAAGFRNAVAKDYYFQMYYDDLPIWGFIGKVDKEGKTVPSEYADDEEALDDQEETGWKYIHGDVFRFPKYKSVFAAALGSGTQLFTLATFIFLLALVGVFYPYNRGALFTALVVIYALTSGIAGYTGASFYCQLEGTNWVRNLLLTGALPFGTIVVIFLIWALVTSPLLVLGGIAGKNSKAEFQAPVRTTKYPRDIPPLPWYRGTLPQMAMAGFLPFSAIYIELYYIFASIWGHRIYTIYSILFIVFIILIIVTAFITVALTYFQLAAEDHEWWWRSFLCGGSTGLFIYGYCLYYYYARSEMSGFMQTSFFFGYMACVCYAFFLMLGAVGFCAALFFVRHIYHSIKCE